jgi:hypothetical protein
MAVVASRLLAMSPDELDELFAASPAGPIPAGIGRGTAIIAPGSAAAKPLAELVKMLFWQGKSFDPDRHDLLNLLTPFSVRAIRAEVYESESRLDERPCIVLDYAKSSLVARSVRDEIRQVREHEYLGIVFLANKRLPVHFHLIFSGATSAPV